MVQVGVRQGASFLSSLFSAWSCRAACSLICKVLFTAGVPKQWCLYTVIYLKMCFLEIRPWSPPGQFPDTLGSGLWAKPLAGKERHMRSPPREEEAFGHSASKQSRALHVVALLKQQESSTWAAGLVPPGPPLDCHRLPVFPPSQLGRGSCTHHRLLHGGVLLPDVRAAAGCRAVPVAGEGPAGEQRVPVFGEGKGRLPQALTPFGSVAGGDPA